jgi:cysteine desulfurase
MQEHYFDWNSTTPLADEVWEAMLEARRDLWGNPASVHGAGRRARGEVENAREYVAATLGFHARDVVFTCGGTEANNLALHDAPALVVSRLEHPSVLAPAERLERSGKPVVWLPTPESGWISAQAVAEGLEQVAHAVQARLHVDAVQLVGKGPHDCLDAADSVALTAHKFRGPKGIGALLYRGKAPHPLLVGGAQERGLRPGTQDAALAVGFRLALRSCGPTCRP